MHTELYSAINHIIEHGPNPAEFLVTRAPKELAVDRVDRLLEAWALAYAHQLRPPEGRNPVQFHSRDEGLRELVDRLERDIVFRWPGFDSDEANQVARCVFEQLAVVDAAVITFPIRDWTFSEVVLLRGEENALVLAFLGED
ncbi:hypothetical protein [Pelomonas sp. Root1237]|uniref:hypothetical protein n=1 Tax=Pelomonas sp. Root1237 TaxID=1736434 RepID=UPI0006F384F7|nr:hypothetical protein [Pelomonas sp. Root1237]KQV85995.1 hypothetical protein ASC91_22730 [Pelomonas sp. Root1237]